MMVKWGHTQKRVEHPGEGKASTSAVLFQDWVNKCVLNLGFFAMLELISPSVLSVELTS